MKISLTQHIEPLWLLYEQERDISSQRRIGCACSGSMYCKILSDYYEATKQLRNLAGLSQLGPYPTLLELREALHE